MRTFLQLSILVFFTISICNAQVKKDFCITPYWKKGETKTLTIIQSSIWTPHDREDSYDPDTTGIFSIKVIDKTIDSYIIEWSPIPMDNQTMESDFEKYWLSKFKFIIVTDLNGRFKKLKNWKSLVELNRELKDFILTEAKKEGLSDIDISKALSELKLAESEPELIESCDIFLNIYLGNYGEHFILNDTIYLPSTIPTQFFKEGIPVTSETITKEINDKQVMLRFSSIYDYEKLSELQKKYYPDQDFKDQEIISYGEFIYNKQTGWFDSILFYNKRESMDEGHLSVIRYIIE